MRQPSGMRAHVCDCRDHPPSCVRNTAFVTATSTPSAAMLTRSGARGGPAFHVPLRNAEILE
jgi:hypothetical protein